MAKTDTVRTIAEPLAAAEGADVYDVTFNGGTLSVSISRRDGIDLDTLAELSREIEARLDADDLIGGSYTLEVSSPGLERPLRTPGHFAGAVGESVTIRTRPGIDGERRVRGVITASDERSVTVELEEPADDQTTRTVALDDIERARTIFSWGAKDKPKPGSGQKKNPQNDSKKARS